jgi:hypothetical protein
MNRIRLFSMLVAGASSVASGAGIAAEALPGTLRACMAEQDDARRLACFDRESARLTQSAAPVRAQPAAAAPASVVATTAPAAAAPAAAVATTAAPAAAAAGAQSAEDKFGYRGNLARAEVDQQQAAEQQFETLTATVTALSTQPRGELVLTLDNGQVWAQKAADKPLQLKIGDQVSIRRASLGSFLLSPTNGKGSMRVFRTK